MDKNKNIIPERLKQTLINMKQRSYNPNATSYQYYGGKGISICKEWLNNLTFYEWALNNGYQDDLSIDRKDVNGNYEPNNCRWATDIEQANNRTNNIFIESNGETKTTSQWSQETGISREAIKNRSEKGKNILDDYYSLHVEINGKIKTLNELSEESSIPYNTIMNRYYLGWNAEDLIKPINENINREAKHIEINGEIHTATEWAEISGLTREIILKRIQYGWKNEDLLKPRIKNGKKVYIEIDGESHTKDEWCSIIGISVNTFYQRIRKGYTGKKMLAPNSKPIK